MSLGARIAAAKQHPMITLKNAWAKVIGATALRKYVLIQIPGGHRIYLHRAALSRAFYINPNERIRDFNVLKLILRPGSMYIDVGANIGTTAIPASSIVGSAGRVWAFEAHPRIAQYLAENLTLNELTNVRVMRSEERRVGKECRSRRSPYHEKKKEVM